MALINKMIWCKTNWFPHHYGFCPSEKAWKALAKSSKRDLGAYPETKGATTSLFQSTEHRTRTCVVTVAEGHKPHVVVSLLVHEGMHIWRDIREKIGEEHPSSEFEAYAMQNIVADLIEAYERTRGPLFLKRPPPLR